MNWVFFAVGASVLVAILTIIEKKTLIKEHAMKFSTVLALFNVIISVVYLPKVNFNISGTALFFTYIASVFGGLAFLFLAKGVRHTEVSLSSPLLNFGPAVTAILAFILLHEALSIWQILGIAVLIVGTYVLEVDHSVEHLMDPFKRLIKSKYVHFIFFAILMYGLASIVDKHVISNLGINTFTYLFFAHLFIAFNYFVMISIYYGGTKDIVDGIKNSGKYIIIIAVLITLARLMMLEAISIALVSLVIPLKRLSTLFVTIFGGKFFHEKGLKLKIIGCIIMLGGVFFVVYPI